MGYVNVGAKVNGVRPKTKKELKAAMASDPASVTFDSTSMFDGGATYEGNAIPSGTILSVVGPDPYTKRSWYANVGSNGKVS